MHAPRLPLLLVALLAMGSCDPGIRTQVIIHYRTDYLHEVAARVRIVSVREGLEDMVVDRALMGAEAQAMFPLTVPVTPRGGDSSRRFRVIAEFFDSVGATVHRRETSGGFQEGERLEVIVRLDEPCDMVDCMGVSQTCVVGQCQSACVIPVEREGRDETPSVSCGRFRKLIQLDGFNVDALVERLPVAVSLTDPDLVGSDDDDGSDIAFADTTGAALPHELVSYNPDDGSLIAWVLAPDIRPGDDTEFYLYFGGASAPVYDGAVWSGFEGVWHLDEEGDVADDQSPLNNPLTTTTDRPSVPGVVHRAQTFPGRGTDSEGNPLTETPEDFVYRGSSMFSGFEFSAQDSFSLSLWVKLRTNGYLVYRGSGNRSGFKFSEDRAALNDGSVDLLVGPERRELEDEWTLVTLVVERGDLNQARLYWNGDDDPDWLKPDLSDFGAPTPSENFFNIGGTGGCCQIGGFIDEVWVERAAWSQTRIRAMHHNQSNPPESIRVGELEALY